MTKISVIVPNYNHGAYLEQRLNSIFNQSFKDFEVLIFDDCSNDNSEAIIDSFKGRKEISHVEIAKQNSGSPFGFWQKGILLAKGELIWIAESDDFSDEDFLARHSINFEREPSIGISFSASNWVNENGEIIERPSHEDNYFKKEYKDCLREEFMKGTFIYNASSTVFKKELCAELDFQKLQSFKYAGDWYFWTNLTAVGKVVRIPERLNNFRRHLNNVSFKAEKDGLRYTEGLHIVSDLMVKTAPGFLAKQKIIAYWALKLYNDKVEQKNEILSILSPYLGFWYRLAPILNFLK